MGLHDKHLLYVLKRILTAPIRMPDGTTMVPGKGTPQGGIISPLLANIVLNELDHWVASQWEEHPRILERARWYNGVLNKGHGYRKMRTTDLKEMYIVRYADDFRIFCRTKADAERIKIAVTQWLKERLKLEVSQEKTKIVNIKRHYMEFLGFKFALRKRGEKSVLKSNMSDKQLQRARAKLVGQAKRIAAPPEGSNELKEIQLYNSMVMGIQNYYRIATCVYFDCREINRAVMTVLTNRLRMERGSKLTKCGRELTNAERCAYGKTKMLRYVAGTNEPIYPIGYIRYSKALSQRSGTCPYTAQGRMGLHDNLRVNTALMHRLLCQPLRDRSIAYADSRISLFSAQWGKCAVTGREFQMLEDIHCHHKIPRKRDGTDAYSNLILVLEPVHKLIHAAQPEAIATYMSMLQLDGSQLSKLNELRVTAGLEQIRNN
jgi:hypothetical protein